MSLGFRKVAHEDADTIVTVSREAIEELGTIVNPNNDVTENFLVNCLSKLSFYMSDRASNEKAANRKFDEWRDSVLKDVDEKKKSAVHKFYCMAHVLLGLHEYSKKPLKEQQLAIETTSGKFGRSALPMFAFFRFEIAVSRVVRMVSETFGPVGDHLGVREQWEQDCIARKCKSRIGNYKDNRFNCLFETAAATLHHCDDFISLLLKIEKPNKKLKAVLADLQCPVTMTLVQAAAVMHMHVTGPYWDMVSSGLVKYLDLYKYVKPLRTFVEDAQNDPSRLLQRNIPALFADFKPVQDAVFDSVLEPRHTEHTVLLHQTIKIFCSAFLQCIDKQLADFLQEGCYAQASTTEEQTRTNFSQVSNLACEHHFGDLDSSQKRRPNATFHRHSTVQLLKRNRRSLAKWLKSHPQKSKLLQDARRFGAVLKRKHYEQQKSEERIIHAELMTAEERIEAKKAKAAQRALNKAQKSTKQKTSP